MSEPKTADDDLNSRIANAKDRLLNLLEAATNESDTGQLGELIEEEESEIMRLETSRDAAQISSNLCGGTRPHSKRSKRSEKAAATGPRLRRNCDESSIE